MKQDHARRIIAVDAIVRRMESEGASFEDIIRSLAMAEDKAIAYELKGLPVPGDLEDEPVAGIAFEPPDKRRPQ